MAATREKVNCSVAAGVVQLTVSGRSRVVIGVEAGEIRFTTDGTTPVAGVAGDLAAKGLIVPAESAIEITGDDEIAAAKFIANTGLDAVLECAYSSN